MNKDFKVQPVGFFNILTEAFLKESIVRDAHKTAIISILYANPAKTQKVYDSLNGQQNAFVFDAKTLTSKMIKSLSNDFNLVFYICGCLVFFFLWFSFGRFELSLIAFLPMAISWIWILGIMGLLDIRFNIVNIILATFIFGLGDDYTIFIVDGLMYEYAYGKKMLSSYKTSVFLSALMMLVGIGVLIFAAHPAMRSLAEVTIIGMFCVVLIAFILPPLIFKWMVKTKGQYRLMPVSWINAVLTVYSFVVFLIGSLWLTIYGFWLLKLQKPTDHRKLLFHKALCGASRFVVKYIPGVKCRVDNEPNENFENPAIIICNHQSHLDLMYLLMLSPKVIVLTNQWVWHCPFYGMIIRFADFYPVVNGIESNVEMLGALMDKGYSIAIFPEGTRSVDCSIKRFHKGAFYLAEKLHRDIVPVIFHGIGHVLPKKEFLLRRGEIHVKCLPRIKANSLQFGVHYVENSKALRHYVIEEYAALAQKVETPDYFKSAVKGNYRYKGKTIEAEVSRSLQNMAVIKKMIAALPPNSIVLMLNCGIGALSLLTALARKEVTILAMDECEDNIAVASNCSLVPKNLTYKVGKVNDVNPEAFARIIDLQKIRNNEA
jgi:Predicted exporters of the RND superfamily